MATKADEIRAFASKQWVKPAKVRGKRSLTIVAGDVHRRMGLTDRVPNVCSALASKRFLQDNGLQLLMREGPPSGKSSTARFTYGFLTASAGPSLLSVDPDAGDRNAKADRRRDQEGWDAFLAVRGIAKGVWDQWGGGEEFLRRERAAWISPADSHYEERERQKDGK